MLLVILTAFGLFTINKSDLVRFAESQKEAIAAAILYDQFPFVAGTGRDTNAEGIDFSAAISLLYCLEKSFMNAQF